MNRFQEAEKLAATVREQIPSTAVRWLAAVREPLEALTTAALDPAVTDEMFVALVDEFSKDLPAVMKQMNHDALAQLMEDGMGAAAGNGIAGRLKTQDGKTQDKLQ